MITILLSSVLLLNTTDPMMPSTHVLARMGLSPQVLASSGFSGAQTEALLQDIEGESGLRASLAVAETQIAAVLRQIEAARAALTESPFDATALGELADARSSLVMLKTQIVAIKADLVEAVSSSVAGDILEAGNLSCEGKCPAPYRRSEWVMSNLAVLRAARAKQSVMTRSGGELDEPLATALATLAGDSDVSTAAASLALKYSEVEAAFVAVSTPAE